MVKKDQKNMKLPPIKIVIWCIIFALIILFISYSYSNNQYKKIDQSQFEDELILDKIESAIMTPIDGKLMNVSGKYKNINTTTGENLYTAKIIYTDSLDSLLREKETGKFKINVDIKENDNWVRNILYTIFVVVAPIILLYLLFFRQLGMAGKNAMQFGKSKARIISPDKNKVKFDDVAGIEEAKEDIMEIMDYLKNSYKFKVIGAKIPKGAILIGAPGTGKTMLAKAIAGESGVPFFSISGSDFVEMFVGVGASRVRDMFEQARKEAPSLIFIDEIDAVGRSRFSGIGGGHDEREQTLNAMLVEMDGLETQEGVIVLAATNRPDVLDPALMRPGRFDRKIILDLPDINGRKKILEVHIKNVRIDKMVCLDTIARGTPGFSGADLANIINEAALLAARKNKNAISMKELEDAKDRVCWGKERKSRRISDKEREIIACHEAGHALTNLYCKYSIPLHKVTIIPRGMYLGATFQLSEEDKYLQSKNELEDMITIMMGGRNAEEIMLNDITSGAIGDINEATKLAKKMVCSFGMNSKIGTISYGEKGDHIFLGRDIMRSEGFSEQTAREIEEEVKKMIDNAKLKSYNILKKYKKQLKLLTEKLLEVETLSVKEIKELINIK